MKIMHEILDRDVIKKLSQHSISEDDYKLKMGKKHGEGREGIPYRMLIIRKNLPVKERTDLELELRDLDETLCVVFGRFRK